MLKIKMSVAGNSFVLTDDYKNTADNAVSLCEKYHTDGVAYISKNNGSFGYFLRNADGSGAAFCGNVTMCFAKLLFDRGLVKDKTFYISTPSKKKKVTVISKGKKCSKIALEVDKPHFYTVYDNRFGSVLLRLKIKKKDIRIRAYPIDVGNRHLVIFNRQGVNFSDEEIVNAVNESGLFSDGINIEFATIYKNKIKVRVYERGCGKTLACGSGACAVAFAAKQAGYRQNFIIEFEGGSYNSVVNKKSVTITGTPVFDEEAEMFYDSKIGL